MARPRPGTTRAGAFPLPVAGYDARADERASSPKVAAVLHNLRPTGTGLRSRPALDTITGPSDTIQRIPVDFGRRRGSIELSPTGASYEGAVLTGRFAGDALHAQISGNVLIADRTAGLVRFDGARFFKDEFTVPEGVALSRLDGVTAHHDRVFAWDTGGPPDFYYGAVGAVMGPLTRFPLSRLGNVTGRIRAMLSLTRDSGAGSNDALAIFTDTGQIVVYEGFDPGDASDWRLAGRVTGAAPRSRLGFAQVGPDAWMLTAHGIVPVSAALRGNVAALTSPLSAAIADELTPLLASGEGTWSLVTAPEGDLVGLNWARDGTARQWWFDTQAKAWWTSDLPARCFHGPGLDLRFTAFSGREVGLSDLDPAGAITMTWRSGWIDAPGRDAGLSYLEPLLLIDGRAKVRLRVDGDEGLSVPWQAVSLGAPGQTRQRLRHRFAVGLSAPRVRLHWEFTAPRLELLGLDAGFR
jgi:hypothetical protein